MKIFQSTYIHKIERKVKEAELSVVHVVLCRYTFCVHICWYTYTTLYTRKCTQKHYINIKILYTIL